MSTNAPLIIRFHAEEPGELPAVRPREVSAIVGGLEEVTQAVAGAAGTLVSTKFVYATAPRPGSLEILIAAKVELDAIASANDVSTFLDIVESGSTIATNLVLLVIAVLTLRNGERNIWKWTTPALSELAQSVETDRAVRRSVHELYQKSRPQSAVSIDISFGEAPMVQLFPSTLPTPPTKVFAAVKSPLPGKIRALGEPWSAPVDIYYLGKPAKAVTATAVVASDRSQDARTSKKKCLAIWHSKMPIPDAGMKTVEARVLGEAEAMDIVLSEDQAERLDFSHVIEVLRVENVEWG